jgi:hypothetical protein
MKYRPIGEMKCPFCGQLNLVTSATGSAATSIVVPRVWRAPGRSSPSPM